jgi:hypothetical protein
MPARFLFGNRFGTTGMWITRPGYDCFNDDPNDEAKFFFSTHWNQRPLRFSASGYVASNTSIPIPSIAGAQPLLFWRPMSDQDSERANGYVKIEAGDVETYGEFHSIDLGTAFRIRRTDNTASTAYRFRYALILF